MQSTAPGGPTGGDRGSAVISFNGPHFIVNAQGDALDLSRSNRVISHAFHGDTNQQWTITGDGAGKVTLESKIGGNSRFLGVSGSQDGAALVGSTTPFHWKVNEEFFGFTFLDPNSGLALSLDSGVNLRPATYKSTLVCVLKDTAGNREAILNGRVALAAASSYKARVEQLDLETATNVIDAFKVFSRSVAEMEKQLTLTRLTMLHPNLFAPAPPRAKIPRRPFEGPTAGVYSVSFSPDGLSVSSGSYDKIVRIWDAQTGHALTSFSGHTNMVTSTAFSPDGTRVASGSFDQTVCILDAQTSSLVSRLTNHSGVVWSVAFSPDGVHVASGSEDGTIVIWEVVTALVVASLATAIDSPVYSVAFSPDGRHLVSGRRDGRVDIWDVQKRRLLIEPIQHTVGHFMLSAKFSPNGKRVVSASGDGVCVWDVETGHIAAGPFRGHTNRVTSVAYSPDGTHIVSGSDDSTLRIWDAQTGSLVAEPLQGHSSWVKSVAYSPDGTRIVSGSNDKTVRIWDAQTI